MTDNQYRDRSPFQKIFYPPGEDRLRVGWRLLVQILIWVFVSFVFALPFAGMLLQPDQGGISFYLVNGFVTAIPVTISVYLARRWLDRRSFLDLGLHWDALAVRELFLGFGLTGVMFVVIYLLELVFGWLQFEAFSWQEQPLSVVLQGTLIMLLAYIFTGWGEELLFRGYWLQNLIESSSIFWGVVISSTIFALAHLLNPNPSLGAVLGLIAGGLFFAYAYLRTRRLWLPVGIHIGWNFFEGVVFGFQVSGTQPFRLIQQTVSGPEVITGGAFGPEAGLILLPALLLGLIAIYIYTGNGNIGHE